MRDDDRLSEQPTAADDRLSEQPTTPPVPPWLLGDIDLSLNPVTIRVVAYVFLAYMIWPFVTMALLTAAGLGPPPQAPPAEPTEAAARFNLSAAALAFPLQMISLLPLRRLTGAYPWQIGLTPRRFGWNCLRGVAGWALLTPACLGVNLGVVALYGAEAPGNVHEHPFVQMAHQGLSPSDWFLLVFTATLAAPAMEEVLFRGAILSWLRGRPWAAHLAMALAFLLFLPMKGDELAYWRQGGIPLLIHCVPTLFGLTLVAAYGVVWRLSRTPAGPAVFASSALFAAVHSFAWPTPVALFVLALGLGMLTQRTRSLVGPIVLHGLFNAVSCALLFWQ